MTVINPLNREQIKLLFDEKALEAMKYFLIKSLFAQPEAFPNQPPLPLQIPKEHVEQWFAQALGVSNIGGGSYPIDVYSAEDEWGADIKMLSIGLGPDGTMSAGDSGEASLGQKFTGIGRRLDSLMENREYDIIKDAWLEIYKEKFTAVTDRYQLNDYYYFFLIRCGQNFYLFVATINLEKLEDVTVDSARSNPETSVWLNNMIADKYGNSKVYKAKKRLELRLRPKAWVSDGLAIEFKTNYLSIEANIREDLSTENFREKAFEALNKLKVEII